MDDFLRRDQHWPLGRHFPIQVRNFDYPIRSRIFPQKILTREMFFSAAEKIRRIKEPPRRVISLELPENYCVAHEGPIVAVLFPILPDRELKRLALDQEEEEESLQGINFHPPARPTDRPHLGGPDLD